MRIISFVVCFLLSACSWDTISKDWGCPEVIYCDCRVEKDIILNAQNYIDYLKKVGKSPVEDINKIPHPFSEECRKTINGKHVAGTTSEFVSQLSDVRKLCHSWTTEVLEILPSSQANAATIRYIIQAPPVGTFLVIKVVHFDDFGKVREVNEVFSPLEDSKTQQKRMKGRQGDEL